MAAPTPSTWTQVASNIYNGSNVHLVASSGTMIYYIAATGSENTFVVYEFDPSDDSSTAISNSTSFPSETGIDKGTQLAWFKGDLYIILRRFTGTTVDRTKVFRWDGSGTSWTQVFTLEDPFGGSLYVDDDDSIMVALLDNGGTSGSNRNIANATYYTENGTDWTQGSFEDDIVNHVIGSFTNSIHNGTQLGIFAKVGYAVNGFGITASHMMQFNPSTKNWDKIVADYANVHRASGADYHWDDGGSTYQYTASWSGYSSPTDGAIIPIFQINMPVSVGYKLDSNDIDLYYWDDTDWSSAETVGDFGGGGAEAIHIVRLDDGRVYLIALDSSGNNEIWERDDPIEDAEEGPAELRYLGMTADTENLYLTGLEGSTLKLWTVDHETVTRSETNTFGSGTFAELDARTRAIFPAHTYLDGIVLLRGRDGSNVVAQQSTDSGANFSSLDDGGWASDAYAVALLVDVMNQDDMLCVFSNDDIYQTTDGGASWSKVNDAPDTLRAAARHLVRESEIVVAEQTAGDMHFSNNAGATFTDVSDASIGVINHIERVLYD